MATAGTSNPYLHSYLLQVLFSPMDGPVKNLPLIRGEQSDKQALACNTNRTRRTWACTDLSFRPLGALLCQTGSQRADYPFRDQVHAWQFHLRGGSALSVIPVGHNNMTCWTQQVTGYWQCLSNFGKIIASRNDKKFLLNSCAERWINLHTDGGDMFIGLLVYGRIELHTVPTGQHSVKETKDNCVGENKWNIYWKSNNSGI